MIAAWGYIFILKSYGYAFKMLCDVYSSSFCPIVSVLLFCLFLQTDAVDQAWHVEPGQVVKELV